MSRVSWGVRPRQAVSLRLLGQLEAFVIADSPAHRGMVLSNGGHSPSTALVPVALWRGDDVALVRDLSADTLVIPIEAEVVFSE
jgi:hypothetical protein